jgi:hypothetical protein
MQESTLQHADTFFFFTTIAVTIGIIILLVILYICFKALKFLRNITARAHYILDKTSEAVDEGLKEGSPVKRSLPMLLPLVGMLFKKKKKVKKDVAK